MGQWRNGVYQPGAAGYAAQMLAGIAPTFGAVAGYGAERAMGPNEPQLSAGEKWLRSNDPENYGLRPQTGTAPASTGGGYGTAALGGGAQGAAAGGMIGGPVGALVGAGIGSAAGVAARALANSDQSAPPPSQFSLQTTERKPWRMLNPTQIG